MRLYYFSRRIISLAVSILFLSSLLSCDIPLVESPVQIKKILDNPRDYEGKTITISGQVIDVFSLFVVKTFAVRDKTGEIIVVTERMLPKKGASIKVRGKVIDAFSFGDKTITAFAELKE
jgi:hypothetical protein